jgi:hypothetical protein
MDQVTKLRDLRLCWDGPLLEAIQPNEFYREEVNKTREQDIIAELSRQLQESYENGSFKTFVTGHFGVGKSTELRQLEFEVRGQQRVVRVSVASELNPATFKIVDVLLLMIVRLVEETNKHCGGFFFNTARNELIRKFAQWFGEEARKKTDGLTASAEAGINLLGQLKGTLKYEADRKAETVEHRLKRLPELVHLCDEVIAKCKKALWDREHKEWLLIVEDLDENTVPPQQVRELFLKYGTVFQDLDISMIFTIPVWLEYSQESVRLPFERHMIFDTPVYDWEHAPHKEGRQAMAAVLEARVSSALFEEDQMMKLIVASGGNFRDLFSLVRRSGRAAFLRHPEAKTIAREDSLVAIKNMRREYRNRLGSGLYEPSPTIPLHDKFGKLVAVYNDLPECKILDPTMHWLLLARAVQELRDAWYGVHPLVVDILKEQRRLGPRSPGGTE